MNSLEGGGSSSVSAIKIIAAFAVIYIVWGSTFFFIRMAVQTMPVTVMGTLRFTLAGILMLCWCSFNGERLWTLRNILPAVLTGLLLLYIGNGAVAWSEQFLASSLVAVFVATSPMWFVILDYSKWKENFSSKKTIAGIVLGFAGILLLFSDNLIHTFSSESKGNKWAVLSLGVLTIGSVSWAAGSLYGKYKATGFSGSLNAGWQMLAAGIAYALTGMFRSDWSNFHWQDISPNGWGAIAYLVTMGSLLGYSAFVWLLSVRQPSSTHAYVNPVIAVVLGVYFAGETITGKQIAGLAVILGGVVLVNLAKYMRSL